MFNQLSNITNTSKLTKEVTDFFINYKDCKNNLTKKLRLFCNMNLSEEARERIVSMVDEKTRTYYNLGLDVIRASGYSIARLDKQISNKLVNQTNLASSIYQEFKEGEKTSKIELKTKLQKIYDLLGSKQTAKASDLEKYFELKSCKVKNSQTGKWEHGFELVKKK
jgi:predicted DNA-binding ribbon-helix-helix protein